MSSNTKDGTMLLGGLAALLLAAKASSKSSSQDIVSKIDRKLENSRLGFIKGRSPSYIVGQFAQAQEMIHSPQFEGSPNSQNKKIVTQKFIELGTELSR